MKKLSRSEVRANGSQQGEILDLLLYGLCTVLTVSAIFWIYLATQRIGGG